VPPTAAVVNVTATEPSVAGYVTAFPAQHVKPLASDLNFTAGLTVPNLVVVQLGPDGAIDFFNMAGSTHLIVDLLGYYTGDVVLAPGLHPLGAATTAAIAAVTDTGVEFTGSPGALDDLATGDIITAGVTPATPDGLLRIVDSLARPAGNLTLTTHQAALDQVIAQGSLRVDGSTAGAAVPTPSALSAGFSAGPSFTRTIAIDDGTVHATGTITAEATISAEISIGLFPPHVDSDITGEVSGNGDVSFDAEVERSVSECQDLPSIRLAPLTFLIGPVPIVISPSMQPKVCVEGEAEVGVASHGSASFSAGLTTHTHNGSVSVDPFESHSLDLGLDGRPAVVDMTFTLGATVSAELAVSIDGVHVLEVGPSAGVEMTFNGCRITLTAKLGLAGTLQVRFLEFESPAYPIDIPLASKDFDPIDVVKCAYWTGTYETREQYSYEARDGTGKLFDAGTVQWTTTFSVGTPPSPGAKAPGTRRDVVNLTETSWIPCDSGVTTTTTADQELPAEYDSSVVTLAEDGNSALELGILDDGSVVLTADSSSSCFGNDRSTSTYFRGGGGPYVRFLLNGPDSKVAAGSRTEPIGGAPGDQATGSWTYTWSFTKHCFFGLDPDAC
jgi:hypothetical protein